MKSRIAKSYNRELSSVEQKAMEAEIKRQLKEFDRKHTLELDALILWQLHTQLGFGPKRLRRFYDNFSLALDVLGERYDLDDSGKIWKCTEELKEYGIDIAEWDAERTKKIKDLNEMAHEHKKHMADAAERKNANEGIQKKQ